MNIVPVIIVVYHFKIYFVIIFVYFKKFSLTLTFHVSQIKFPQWSPSCWCVSQFHLYFAHSF